MGKLICIKRIHVNIILECLELFKFCIILGIKQLYKTRMFNVRLDIALKYYYL